MATLGISLDSIAGIAPKVSTLADVRRLLGDGHVTERLRPHQTKRRLLPAKILLHYPDTGIVVVFVDTGDTLPPDAVVSVVGVEQGSPLATVDGLQVGMDMVDAEAIVLAGYREHHRSPWCVEVVAADGSGENYLGIHVEDSWVAFLGLYRREVGDF